MVSNSILKAAKAVLFASFLASSASATCNPLHGSCDPNNALGGSLDVDFRNGAASQYRAYQAPDKVSYGSKGMDFEISQQGDNPTAQSDFYIMFGHLEVVAQAAPGTGIVSSVVLISDDLDEVDIEWLGGDTTQVQSNYFSKGDTSTYDRGQFHSIDAPQSNMHTYAIDWTSERIVWYIDGTAVRTLTNPGTGYYPQSPMQVRIGSWAGGDSSNSEGTIEWAGGATDYSAGPFNFYIQSLNVVDYSTGTEYSYGDQSGDWTSIQVTDGKINGNLDGSASANSAVASSSAASSTSFSGSSSSAAVSSTESSAAASTTESAAASSTSVPTAAESTELSSTSQTTSAVQSSSAAQSSSAVQSSTVPSSSAAASSSTNVSSEVASSVAETTSTAVASSFENSQSAPASTTTARSVTSSALSVSTSAAPTITSQAGAQNSTSLITRISTQSSSSAQTTSPATVSTNGATAVSISGALAICWAALMLA